MTQHRVIRVERLTKRYGGTVAVDDLSFDVQPGRVTGFLGPNGAGKTTTMRLILGLDRPSAGHATISGVPYPALRNPLCQVGALLEARAAHPGRRAVDHLRWLARSNGIARRRVDEVLELVGLAEVRGRRAKAFSLGMSQRLGVAACLLGDPGVLLFDEPVNGLDPEGIRWIRNLLKALAAEGRTVLVSSHLMSEMALTADHLVVIGRGKLLLEGSVQELTARGATQRVQVRADDPAKLHAALVERSTRLEPGTGAAEGALLVTGVDIREVGRLAFAAGVVLHELVSVQPTLEEAFMALTATSAEFRSVVGEGTG